MRRRVCREPGQQSQVADLLRLRAAVGLQVLLCRLPLQLHLLPLLLLVLQLMRLLLLLPVSIRLRLLLPQLLPAARTRSSVNDKRSRLPLAQGKAAIPPILGTQKCKGQDCR